MQFPLIVLNNRDGFDAKQMESINKILVSERNRFNQKSKQATKTKSVRNMITAVSDTIIAHQSKTFAEIASSTFYLNSQTISENKKTAILECENEIKAFCITGSLYTTYTTEGDLANYFQFEAEGNRLYATKITPVDSQFQCFLTVYMEE
jgi:hypothetical protein